MGSGFGLGLGLTAGPATDGAKQARAEDGQAIGAVAAAAAAEARTIPKIPARRIMVGRGGRRRGGGADRWDGWGKEIPQKIIYTQIQTNRYGSTAPAR